MKNRDQSASSLIWFSLIRLGVGVTLCIALLIMTAFAWATTLTGLVSVTFIQQPVWWILVLLWTALIIFTVILQILRHPHFAPFFIRMPKAQLIESSGSTEILKSERIVESMKDQFSMIVPQVAAALELPFQHMGVRTEDHRQEIENAVNALYHVPDFDKQAFSDCLQRLLLAAKQNWTSLAAFSPREREILELLLQDISYKEMGHRLYVSTSTIKTHVYHIFQKLGISNREEAIDLIRERGWFPLNERKFLPASKQE